MVHVVGKSGNEIRRKNFPDLASAKRHAEQESRTSGVDGVTVSDENLKEVYRTGFLSSPRDHIALAAVEKELAAQDPDKVLENFDRKSRPILDKIGQISQKIKARGKQIREAEYKKGYYPDEIVGAEDDDPSIIQWQREISDLNKELNKLRDVRDRDFKAAGGKSFFDL